jgi:hypothetical protein
MTSRDILLFSSIFILALGVSFAGSQIGGGLSNFRSYDRYVTVKGLATREVEASLAVWPLAHAVTGNDLASLQQTAEERSAELIVFLKSYGLKDEEIKTMQVNVSDLLAQTYRSGDVGENRYIINQTIMVRSDNLDAIEKAAQNVGEIVKKGVALTQAGINGPSYLFTNLNAIKPAMIAEATKNARAVADQFAADTGQAVGEIRTADQGLFQILPRDETYIIPEEAQRLKTVRVVSTIDFYLE